MSDIHSSQVRKKATSEAMIKVTNKLIALGFNLSKMVALEFFAREGDWHTKGYCNHIKKLYAWEIEKKFIAKLKINLPNAIIENGDSFIISKKNKYKNYFDLIVIDNPQNVFNGYCEHFDVIERVNFLLKNKGIIIFNINVRPYNLKENPEWKKRRDEFYKVDSKNMTLKFMCSFYKKKFQELGLNVNDYLYQKRHESFLYYLVFFLTK